MRLLILGGITEAQNLASTAARDADVDVTLSVFDNAQVSDEAEVVSHVGRFGGRDGLQTYLQENRFDAVLDATHPFSTRISNNAAALCHDLGIEHAQYLRRPWLPSPEDNWTFLNSAKDVAGLVGKEDAIYLATDRADLNDLGDLQVGKIWCRVDSIPAEPFPLAHGAYHLSPKPHNVDAEMALFMDLEIDWLVVRNAGGQSSWPRMEAARNLGIRVAVIRRPLQPECVKLETMAEAMAWIKRRR